jgi:hypothetical protein
MWFAPCGVGADERQNLRGLEGIYIITNTLENDIIKDGLSTDLLRTDIELRLIKAEITIWNKSDWLQQPGKPYLSVYVFTLKIDNYHYIYNIRVELVEDAQLVRRPKLEKITAVTWDSERLGIVTIQEMQKIRDSLGGLVSEFINDYSSMNPK